MVEKKYIVIGVRLKALREGLFEDWSIQKYTDFLGVKYTRYLNWESGLNRPQPEEAENLCNKLGVTMDFIYRGIEAQLSQTVLTALLSKPLVKAKSTSSEIPD